MPTRLLLAVAVAFGLILPAAAQQRGITIEEVIRIARQEGMVEIVEIDREDDGGWEVEGRDANGRKLELEIDAAGVVTDRDD